MRSISAMSVKGKMLLFAASTTSIALALCFVSIMTAEWLEWRQEIRRNLTSQANIVASNVTAALSFNDRQAAEETLAGLRANDHIIWACLHTPDGKEFARYVRKGSKRRREETMGSDEFRTAHGCFHVRLPVLLEGERIGSIYVQYDLRGLYLNLLHQLELVVVGLLLGLFGTLLISSRIQRVLTRPITELARTAKAIAKKKDYSLRATKLTQDELGQLTDAFNEMLSRIEQRDAELQDYRETLEQRIKERTRELVEARARAEAANRTKSEFLANMSHEIRTPMTAIVGFADVLLEQEHRKRATPKAIEAARTIQRNGKHLITIINDILDLSKIEAGKMAVERIACSPWQIAGEVVSLQRVHAEAKGITINAKCEGPIPDTIGTDPTRLRQILLNLVGNAVKFTERGSVTLETRFVNEATPQLQFDIVDTGHGLTPDQKAGLFRAFTQADASTTRQFGGTGLGLVLSKRFAQMLGGDVVVVESKPGVGTRFRASVATGSLEGVRMLESPSSAIDERADDIPESHDAVSLRSLDGCRILLADDGPDNRRLIAHVLHQAGANLTVVTNGRDAVESALSAAEQRRAFDVILMDMQMPILDGYGAATTLRNKNYTRPIIALTANAMASDREKCIKAGCDDYCTKPIDRKALVQVIHHHWHRQDRVTSSQESQSISSSTPQAVPDQRSTVGTTHPTT